MAMDFSILCAARDAGVALKEANYQLQKQGFLATGPAEYVGVVTDVPYPGATWHQYRVPTDRV